MVVCYGPADRFLGILATVLRRWDSAARHFEAAIEMNRLQGSSPWLAHSQHEYAVMLLERSQQGDQPRGHTLLASALQLAQDLGMTKLGEAVSELLATLETRPQPRSHPGGLTRREAEVLRMIAVGKSNQEIAASISQPEHGQTTCWHPRRSVPPTVRKHLSMHVTGCWSALRRVPHPSSHEEGRPSGAGVVWVHDPVRPLADIS
jgi:hypothetical protein